MHTAYIHEEAGESSLRCTCGRWAGEHLVDVEGHAEHVLVTRPAFRAMANVLALPIVRNEIAFTRVDGTHLVRAEDEHAAASDLLKALLAAVEPHLAAEHYDTAADRIQDAGVQNGERAWPFAMLLREDARQLRADHRINDCWRDHDARPDYQNEPEGT